MVFHDKTVLVTGAGAGIGRAFALGFAADGANVIAFGRTLATLREVAGRHPDRIHVVVGDVGSIADVKRLGDEAQDRFGKVDILVNNAALYPKKAFLDESAEEWARTIQANVIGMASCCRVFLPGMLERGYGRIINLGSFAWMGPIPQSSGYSASKGAVRPFTRALASEIDRARYPNVLINELIPGIVKTSMSDSGEDPAAIYQHAKLVASLPANGPHGETFVQSQLFREPQGLKSRLKGYLTAFLPRRRT